MTQRDVPVPPAQFLVAFSFAGEQRDLVQRIAEAVEGMLGRGTVFYDNWFEWYISGIDGDLKLQQIYEQAEMVVVCVSAQYGGKPWTATEHEAIRARKMQLQASPDKVQRDRILPMRVGEGDVPGILFNAMNLKAVGAPVDETAQKIVKRLQSIMPVRPNPRAVVPRLFLAECTADLDLEEQRDRIRALIEEELGWAVVSRSVAEMEQDNNALTQDLAQCRAFVQLLGLLPWKGRDLNSLQYEAARDLSIPCFRHRSADLDIGRIQQKYPEHHRFISAADVVVSGFEDFKEHLRQKLVPLRNPPPPPETDTPPPLVRVAIRSRARDLHWQQAQRWISTEHRCDFEELDEGETFTDRHQAEPCHGFMIVCDEAALDDGAMSPRQYLRECRDLQLKTSKADPRRPPVAVVYWEPPPADERVWARLVRAAPRHLTMINAGNPQQLATFFAQVRRAAE